MDDVTEAVIGAAVEVHRYFGPGLLESVYEEALCCELGLRNIPYDRQITIPVIYKGHRLQSQRIDLLVQGEVIVELKAQARLTDIVTAQVLSYLKATGLKRALLLNFGARRMVDGIKRYSL